MSFEKIKGKLGFGIMRLKMIEDKVDIEETKKMVDRFLESGFNYFDTAHGYINGLSELALRECLTSRYPRDSYVLADKLSAWMYETKEEISQMFQEELEYCGVDYFDFYLFHCMNHTNYPKYRDTGAFEVIRNLKSQGKVNHIGMSFHDTPEYLDMILTEQPWIEFVQLQINYLDYDDPAVQSKRIYEVAEKHGKKVIVMEPVKGGQLASLPEKAAAVFDLSKGQSHASYALRYAASFPNVFMVLSGMGTVEQMDDNINTFSNFVPFSEQEYEAAAKAREIIREVRQVPCTKCNYCADVCPLKLPISSSFFAYNSVLAAKKTKPQAKEDLESNATDIPDCLRCGKCEAVCPQHIKIREHLAKLTKMFRLDKR